MSENAIDKPLQNMFTAVPPRYDLINRIITWGLDRGWRKAAARECLNFSPRKLLDVGCGTGDLAITISQMSAETIEVTGMDYSETMLAIARQKAEATGLRNTRFVYGDASDIQFPANNFECVSISFAFRNVTFRDRLCNQFLAEVHRVLQPGGRFVIVESSQPRNKLVRRLFHLYLRFFVANIGYWLSGEKGAYRYLSKSAISFYSPEKVKQLLVDAGFSDVKYQPLFFGAAGIHVATK